MESQNILTSQINNSIKIKIMGNLMQQVRRVTTTESGLSPIQSINYYHYTTMWLPLLQKLNGKSKLRLRRQIFFGFGAKMHTEEVKRLSTPKESDLLSNRSDGPGEDDIEEALEESPTERLLRSSSAKKKIEATSAIQTNNNFFFVCLPRNFLNFLPIKSIQWEESIIKNTCNKNHCVSGRHVTVANNCAFKHWRMDSMPGKFNLVDLTEK